MNAPRDSNRIPVIIGTSSADGTTPTTIYVDPSTHRVLVDLSSGSGTVTSVSVVTANGVSGTVATATTTPAITLTLGAITPSAVQISGLTASQIVGTDASKNLVSLAVATYPSLTELTYVKGVTSSIQTQIDSKGVGTWTDSSISTGSNKTFVTPVLGVASATSLATSAASPLLLTNGQLVTVALTSQTTGATTLTIPDFASVVDEFVFKTKAVTMSNKTFVAPALGAATATSVNGLTITSSTGTFTLTNAKTLAVTNTLTLSGTDSTTMTFPSTSATVARTDAGNTFTGVSTGSAWVLTSPTITTKLNPTTDDGAPLGDTTHNWSDLFLASGAVVNYANSNVVLTHTSGILTLGTGDLRITTAGSDTASAVTVGGTQTLTAKTLTSPTINAATMTGNFNYAAVPSVDHTANGRTISAFNLGATVTIMDLVYLGSSSKWLLTDADAAATAGGVLIGICLDGGVDTDTTTVAMDGLVRDDTWNWTPGAPLYIDTATPGALTATQPSGADDVIRIVGFAVTADVIWLNPSPDYITHT